MLATKTRFPTEWSRVVPTGPQFVPVDSGHRRRGGVRERPSHVHCCVAHSNRPPLVESERNAPNKIMGSVRTSLFISRFICGSNRFSQNTFQERSGELSTLSLPPCTRSYNSLFSCALLRVSPKADTSNVNI